METHNHFSLPGSEKRENQIQKILLKYTQQNQPPKKDLIEPYVYGESLSFTEEEKESANDTPSLKAHNGSRSSNPFISERGNINMDASKSGDHYSKSSVPYGNHSGSHFSNKVPAGGFDAIPETESIVERESESRSSRFSLNVKPHEYSRDGLLVSLNQICESLVKDTKALIGGNINSKSANINELEMKYDLDHINRTRSRVPQKDSQKQIIQKLIGRFEIFEQEYKPLWEKSIEALKSSLEVGLKNSTEIDRSQTDNYERNHEHN
ncbi:unnamed protein product [Moneuplotes crassus]|uniref:Uncharacterized protein n=1 Tax=Euplotes crassus TaxID=5936 RepID=A0AAD1XZY1_EUPCR|nr:unnamed protein product [Moneuplotes crassus]